MAKLENDLRALQSKHAEQETELKIMKRERDEYLTSKVEY